MVSPAVSQEGGVFTALSVMFILLGVTLILIPALSRFLSVRDVLDRVPWIVLYVYRQDGFVFVTSPILILLSLASLLYVLLR